MYEREKLKLNNLPSNKFIRLLHWGNRARIIDLCTVGSSNMETEGRMLFSTTFGPIALSALTLCGEPYRQATSRELQGRDTSSTEGREGLAL